eukprot:scaffold2366_cov115-Cylindrotheca_fusiformis.AAC.4
METSKHSGHISSDGDIALVRVCRYSWDTIAHWEVGSISKQQSLSTVSRNALPTRNNLLSETPVVLIVAKLSPGVGNQLHRIANGQCVKHLVEESLGWETEFFTIPNSLNKAQPTVQACPNIHLHIPVEKTAEDLVEAHELQSTSINESLANNLLDLTNVQSYSERFF